MTKRLLTLLALASIAAAGPCEVFARDIKDVLENSRVRDKVVVEGTIKRAFDFDNFLVADSSSEIAVSFIGVRQDLKAGDPVVVYGKFRGKFSYLSRYGLIEAIEFLKPSDPKAAELRSKDEAPPMQSSQTPPLPPPAPAKNVETRLRELEDLKIKNLISPDEYKDQRKRILDSL